jgi:hypothetical protein
LRRRQPGSFAEETGLRVRPEELRHVVDLVSSSGRPVSAYAMEAPAHAPVHFGATGVGQPAWVPPDALVQSWCTFRGECRAVLEAAGMELQPGTARKECPDCGGWHMCAEESDGHRLPVHRAHLEDPRSVELCSGSLALLDGDGASRIDAATVAGLEDLAQEARATADLAGGIRELGSRGRGVDAGPRR